VKINTKLARGRIHDTHSFWHDFFANAVACDHCNPVFCHGEINSENLGQTLLMMVRNDAVVDTSISMEARV
jgi:hypothetical protein